MARQISGAQWNYLRCIHTDGYDSRYRKNIRTALGAKREGLVEFRKVGLGGRLPRRAGGGVVVTSEPYEEGAAAFRAGQTQNDNPYPVDSLRAMSWDNGWRRAQYEDSQ